MNLLKQKLEIARRSSQSCPLAGQIGGRTIVRAPLRRAAPQPKRNADVQVRVAEATTPNLSGGDVYVVDPKPLEEGVEKHVISIFVADEPGLINRVAGVFARRGANIESLAVGLTVDKALFTVVVAGKAATVANLIKQLSKLVKVRYVEDITNTNRIERELLLLKLRVAPGPARAEVLQLAQIFRARVVDVGDTTLSLSVTGDPGKLTALLKVMAKFGVVEMARTGRICLRRGEALLERGSSLAEGSNEASATPASRTPTASMDRTADVYMVDEDLPGVWDVDNVLEATYAAEGQVPSDFKPYTLNIEVQDVPGVLNQLSKLVFVQTITDLTDIPFVNRELMLVKVRCAPGQRGELRDLATIFRGSILDVSPGSLTIEVLGKEDKMKAFTDLLEPYGILEIARTGRVALARDSGVNSEYLQRMSMGRVW
ncbi:hypothetical protein GPECTOR_3g57 [Gonium pectorale]|uniref:ACT domain-containing protein n=1 Tax=Gonium pectorale TaxID=33097 RepID=A0A150H011_GONPE|nr:hypothetical protein GPECTOR_3g57 [Gonium pectorale]|eukprot:KXZ55405.1 hypothetical protein GPECTOR_3g57 [Gonium pectorale]